MMTIGAVSDSYFDGDFRYSSYSEIAFAPMPFLTEISDPDVLPESWNDTRLLPR